MSTRTAESTRIEARLIRPGHVVRLEYGRRLDLAVEAVTVAAGRVWLDGPLSFPGLESHTYAVDTQHRLTERMRVLSDRNDPPAGSTDGWNGTSRVVRRLDGDEITVWSLDDPTEPLGHGGRLLGHIGTTDGVWLWRAAFGYTDGAVAGDYIEAEAALIAAMS